MTSLCLDVNTQTMKLRIRYQKRTAVVQLEDDACTVKHLRQKTCEVFNLQIQSDEFELSLNGTEPFVGMSNDSPLSDLGIVPGDLIIILVPHQNTSSSQTASVQHSSSSQQAFPQSSNLQTGASSSNHSAPNERNTEKPEKMDICGDEGESSSCVRSSVHETSSTDCTSNLSNMAQMDDSAIKKHLETVGLMGLEDGAGLNDPEVNRYLQAPMLCRESTFSQVPLTLSQTYSSTNVVQRNEALCVVIHVLMNEVGLQTRELEHVDQSSAGCSRSSDLDMRLPTGWRGSGAFRAQYFLPGYEHITCTLTLVPLGQVIVIHGSVSSSTSPICQLKVNPSEFVTQVSSAAENTYQNLDRLSRSFKDRIGRPLMDQLQQEAGLPCSADFTSLLTELKVLILQNLDAQSLVRVSRTCRDLNRASKDNVLWRRLYLRDFGKRSQLNLAQDWYKLYKDMYQLRKRMREQFNHMTMVVPPFVSRPNPLHPFAPFQPGIIGGDYDINPLFSVKPSSLDFDLLPNARVDPMAPLPDQGFPFWRGRGNRDRSFRPRFSMAGSFVKMF